MQKKIKVIFILVISLIVMIYAGNTLYEYFAYTPSERYFYKELKRRIKKGEKEIYLKDLTDFEWDEGYYFNDFIYVWGLKTGKIKNIDISAYKGKYPFINEYGEWIFVFLLDKKLIKIINGKKINIKDVKRKYKINYKIGCKMLFLNEDKFVLKAENN